MNAAGTIGLIADAALFEHGSCGSELFDERRLGVGENCSTRLSCHHHHREQRDGC
ncbi:hypothetical protein [Bradyrhizobium tropiciagri]|uniref:hypothetical protein n=1 Tax=Bradyrhizobium tropiciagri TaxID=312253 RepID=UPI001FCE2640|nr:hypothetical protein [Bradyrhizobium tropiciagri]